MEAVSKLDLGPEMQHYFGISNFKNFSIEIANHVEYKLALACLFALGYAWSSDEHTRRELFCNYVPEKIYACFNANIYFEQPINIGFVCVKPEVLKAELAKKNHPRGH